ncbi:hypothetical protein P8825_15355 [Shouchella clausii]|uniref:hypothetical protein n=1 Tax=Shouchella clausii TaxID=79880 RepID=UPI002DB7485D|nr:hypothetical protein [Shouchella clausii]MEB5480942.1 hypothetical protein [Shouchella clausii]
MKVYLVNKDNGEIEDFDHWIDGAYSTYRKASQSLLDDGYIPYYECGEVLFSREKEDDCIFEEARARIIEMEIDEPKKGRY